MECGEVLSIHKAARPRVHLEHLGSAVGRRPPGALIAEKSQQTSRRARRGSAGAPVGGYPPAGVGSAYSVRLLLRSMRAVWSWSAREAIWSEPNMVLTRAKMRSEAPELTAKAKIIRAASAH